MSKIRETDQSYIEITGAREHNLKNIDLDIPRDKLVVITGLSGNGKSSLAFDTIYAEGQRRYLETLSAYARQFLGGLERPDVDQITGLSPVVSIDQKTISRNPRSTVGTITEVYDFMRLLFARIATAYSYNTGQKMVRFSSSQIISQILNKFNGKKIAIVGDLMLDGYYWGDVSRVSPEAPVPIVEVDKEFFRFGGASNVALNISSLGGIPFLIGIIGKDDDGKTFKKLMIIN